jgi:hypothetical protein
LQKLCGIHKLDKASKVYKGLATADVEVRNFKKIRFSLVKLKVILRIVKRGTKRGFVQRNFIGRLTIRWIRNLYAG